MSAVGRLVVPRGAPRGLIESVIIGELCYNYRVSGIGAVGSAHAWGA